MGKKKIKKKSKDEPRGRGRPSSYDPEFAIQARKLCLLGATDKEMAGFFEVSEQTLNSWKKNFPDFLESLRAGKTKADAEVANKLYDRAIGASWIEDVAFKVKNIEYAENGKKIRETEKIEVVAVRRAAPPDTNACSLWLRNRRRDLWTEKPEPQAPDDPGIGEDYAQPLKVDENVPKSPIL
jgi:transposase-like protein